MGRFSYGDGRTHIDFEDRSLAHLQMVMGSKLRRGECFFFTWAEDASLGTGRHTVWIHPGADLQFHYHGSRTPKLSRDWLEALTLLANSSTGLYLVREPAPSNANTTPATADLRA